MNWLKKQKCVATNKKAQVAHHIRLGTNGGQGIKPSDYFCIPLLNIYHTGGKYAVHNIGEQTFLKHFNLSKEKIFIFYLTKYLNEIYKVKVASSVSNSSNSSKNYEETINQLIKTIESLRTDKDKKPLKIKLPSITENPFYQKAKEEKKIKDKETRKLLKEKEKEQQIKNNSVKLTKNSETDYYQKAKDAKREYDRSLRQKLKEDQKVKSADKNHKSIKQQEYELKTKEAKREYDKKLRDQNKAKQSEYRKAQYKRLKELKK